MNITILKGEFRENMKNSHIYTYILYNTYMKYARSLKLKSSYLNV